MLWYGGDYNPEQWPREVWGEDVVLMRRAGVTVATVGVFSWARLEPSDGEFDFGWLDEVVDGLHAAGIGVDLATATASPPPWLTAAHPEVLATTAEGLRWSTGSRGHHNPGSPAFRRYAERLVSRLAERYAQHPALVAWHVGNEFGNETPRDFGPESAVAFRAWLEARYGSIEAVNEAWGTAFWSQRYGSFDEIQPARATPTFPNPSQALDWERFGSHVLIDAYRREAAILRAANPAIPITTNFMGPFKPADYWAWAAEVDFVSDDCYPDPHDPQGYVYGAFRRDLMRSLAGGKPWLLMEQSTSAVNWRAVNGAKRPGQMRALSYQAIGRGADGIMFFQWRQAVRGAEKFHSAMLPYTGTDTRIWREVVQLGRELEQLRDLAGTPVQAARVAILFDWESWWAAEQGAMPAQVDYLATVTDWYTALHELGVLVDFAHPGHDLTRYDLVVAPAVMVCSDEILANLDRYVRGGGTLLATYLTGILDATAQLTPGGPLGALAATLGMRVEEFAPRPAAEHRHRLAATDTLTGDVFDGSSAHLRTWAETVHTAGAEAIAAYGPGDLAGSPAITRHRAGDGTGWYVSAELEPDAIRTLLDRILTDAGVTTAPPPAGIEITRRGDLTIAVNHDPRTTVDLDLTGTDALTDRPVDHVRLAPFDVAVIRHAPVPHEPVRHQPVRHEPVHHEPERSDR